MSLARARTRQLFGAWGAAMLVPRTAACALAVLAAVGASASTRSAGPAATVGAAVDTILPLGPRTSPYSGAAPNRLGLLPR